MQLTPNLNLKKPEGTDVVDINDLNGNADILDTAVTGKVDKVAGKGLSTEDYTTAEKNKLAGVAAGAQVNTVTSVAGKTGAVTLAKADVGLGNVDNVQQAPITHVGAGGTAHAAATTSAAGFMSAGDKLKLDGVAAGANNYVHPATHPPSIVAQDASNRFVTDAEKANWNGKVSKAGDTMTGSLKVAAPAATISAPALLLEGTTYAAVAMLKNTTPTTGRQWGLYAYNGGTFGLSDDTAGLQRIIVYPDGTVEAPTAFKSPNVPNTSTTDVTYYVRTDGNDSNNGLSNTAGEAFKTIQKAINSLPQVINHTITINVAAGTYAENVMIEGFSGKGTLYLYGATTLSDAYVVNHIHVKRTMIGIFIRGFKATSTTAHGFMGETSVRVGFDYCKCVSTALGYSAAYGYYANVCVTNCELSNHGAGVGASFSAIITSENNIGSGNTAGLSVEKTSIIGKVGIQPTGTALNENLYSGGIITGTVLNPWGDNTRLNRSAVYSQHYGISAITIPANTDTFISFPTKQIDNLNEFDANQTFTAKQDGYYLISVHMGVQNLPAGANLGLKAYVNGVYSDHLGHDVSNVLGYNEVNGQTILFLLAGNTVKIAINSSHSGSSTTPDGRASNIRITRIA